MSFLHHISAWRNEGTGRGDDIDGVECVCGWWTTGDASAAEDHLQEVERIREVNERLARVS